MDARPMSPDVIAELTEAVGGHAAPGTDQDSVVGVRPSLVVRPADTAQVSSAVRVAARHGLAVAPRGSGSRLEWGGVPERCDVVVDLSDMDAVLDHAAGDLIVVAQAGCRLDVLAGTLADARQRLSLDPPRGGTIGGVLATADAGPLRHLGPARDLVLGATFVRSDGVVAKAGGRVVKNVAGYDLGRLLVGSFGTLGIITEVTLRLNPVPPARRWLQVETDVPARILALVTAFTHTQLAPSAVELDVFRDDRGVRHRLAVLLEGTQAGVEARSARATSMLGKDTTTTDTPPSWCHSEPDAPVLLRTTHRPGEVGTMLTLLASGVRSGGAATWRGSVIAGVGRLGLTDMTDPRAFLQHLRAGSEATGGTAVVLEAPVDVRDRLDPWGDVGSSLPLMRAVKTRLDPDRILSPGRFVGGI